MSIGTVFKQELEINLQNVTAYHHDSGPLPPKICC